VPFESLSWSGGGQYFTLNIPESQLKNVKSVPKGNVPTEVKASDLRNLYSQYGVTPYWEKMQKDQQGQQGQQSS
jgi:RNA recognition motif-containing protein